MFEHKLLDGSKIRIITIDDGFVKPEVLEIRDPKNGAPVTEACRTQYGVVEGVLVERYLPPENLGDAWAYDNVASPWWAVVGHPPHGGIVADYNKYIGGNYRRQLDPEKNVVAYGAAGEEVTFDGVDYSLTRKTDAMLLQGRKLADLRQSYYSQ